jgi:two-component system, cell cycle sensor histidine kinase and response regulator CckA
VFSKPTEPAKSEGTIRTLVAAIEQMVEMLVVTDFDGKILYCNPAFEKITGYSKNETVGQNPRFLQSGKHSVEFYRQLWSTIKQGTVWNGRLINRKKDGTFYNQDSTISPIREASGEISGFVAVNLDVTEKLELERQYLEAQKLESVGRLAGGLAHDFNNLLTVINGYADFLLQQLDTEDPYRHYAEEIGKAGAHAASLTKQLLAFSRNQMIEPRVLDLNHTIQGAVPMLQRLIGSDIVLATRLASFSGRVMADPEQIHQIIMNLVINARDAMPAGGRIDIKTSDVDLNEEMARTHPDAKPGPYVLMSVTDTGHGMAEAIRPQIFEPFFTTKAVGKGTGLGLSTVYGIVRQSGGWIELWSEVGIGASFNIYLPQNNGYVLPEPPAIGARPERGGETILLVEDHDAVRSYTRNALEKWGYRVVEASNGEQAIRVATCYLEEIHLLLTDVVMMGMNGHELSRRLIGLRPNMKAVFLSGHTSDALARRGLPDGMVFLQKPFSPDEIAAKVRKALDVHS